MNCMRRMVTGLRESYQNARPRRAPIGCTVILSRPASRSERSEHFQPHRVP
jgi:hypothetical protein